MSNSKPLIWTHAFYHHDQSSGWVPQFEEHARQYFDFVTMSDLETEPEKSTLIIGALVGSGSLASFKELLPSMPSLKVVANFGVGVNHLDLAALAAKGVKVSNTPGVLNNAVAELTIALLLASARCLLKGNHLAKETVSPKNEDMEGIEVRGSTVGIVGMGNIGLSIAKLIKPFGVSIVYHNRTRREAVIEELVGACYHSSLNEMLPVCDFIVLICPLTPQTKHLMGEKQFTLMKKTATLVNVARGGIVDTDALVEALRTGQIRAAALDVSEPEPLPASHELRSLENVIITPHWGSQTFTTRFAMFKKCVENLKALLIDSLPMPDEIII